MNRRDAGDGGPGTPAVAPVGARWAVIVGISRYRDDRLDLRYARRDAEELQALLRTPEGGNFAAANIRLLVDAEATSAALIQALRGFLIEALPEDLVLLYLACHGGSDPRRRGGPLFLYTHDTDAADVAGTAVPMDEIERSLQGLIRAERAVILADTCHSGGLTSGLRAVGEAEATKRYLEAFARTRGGIALLTSAEASESSEEDERWGGGHGVFTHYLLEGMRGGADADRDGIVAVGELFEFVRTQVESATSGRQHPAIGNAPFDRNMPMAVTAELDVQQHLTLARGLVDIGWRLDDPAPFLLAARQLALAADLKRQLPAADADRGIALLAAEQPVEAARVLRVVLAAAPDEVDPGAWLALGVAEAESGRPGPAAEALREYAERDPDGAEAAWATVAAGVLGAGRRPGTTHGLIFGVGQFGEGLSPLPGVANDIRLMSQTMTSGFGVGHLTVLQDDTASAEGVLAAIADIRRRSRPGDGIVVYFSGHSDDRAPLDSPFLVTGFVDRKPVGLSARQIVDALAALDGDVLFILDTHASPAFAQYVRAKATGRISLLLASGVGEVAYELLFDGVMQGVFTYALGRAVAQSGVTSLGALIDAVRLEMGRAVSKMGLSRPQIPRLIGSRSTAPLIGGFPAADLWRMTRRGVLRPDEGPELSRLTDRVRAPLAGWARGRSLVSQGDFAGGRQELERALDDLPHAPTELLIDLAAAALALDDPDAAVRALERAPAAFGPVLTTLTKRNTVPPAVVVIDAEADGLVGLLAQVPALAGADQTVITGQAATAARIVAEAETLARQASRRLAVLVVLGITSTQGPELVLHTSDGNIRMADIARALATPTPEDAENLVVIVDRQSETTSVARDLTLPHHSVNEPVFPGTTVMVEETDLHRTTLRTLLAALPATMSRNGSFRGWVGGASAGVRGVRCNGWVLEDRTAVITARRHLTAARMATAAAVEHCASIEIARREARHESYPEGYLQRGLAREQCGRHAEALADLRYARNLYDDESATKAEPLHDRTAAEWRRQARYHFGRAQIRYGNDLTEAVGALRAARRDQPDDPRVLRMLALAIRALVEQDILVEGSDYLGHYLNAGAPLGADADLVAFYSQRRSR